MSVLRQPCANCGHSFSFHQRQGGARCKAVGCYRGPRRADGARRPCQAFVAAEDAPQDLLEALSGTA